jgi:hypothetical protein
MLDDPENDGTLVFETQTYVEVDDDDFLNLPGRSLKLSNGIVSF